jgi:hypothetical protein
MYLVLYPCSTVPFTLFSVEEEVVVNNPDTPKGTIALLLVYGAILVALWANVYFTMLSRGVNQ